MSERTFSHSHKPDHTKAIGYMCLAVTILSLLDSSVKYLAAISLIPILQIIWVRFVGHTLLSFLMLSPRDLPKLLKTQKPWLQIIRSILMLATTTMNFLALKYLQLDQTVTIFFLSPLIVAALAGPLLGEWVGWRRMLAIMTGFIGVIFVVRPGFGGIHWAAIFCFGAVFGYSLYAIATRYVSSFDSSEVSQFYSPLAGAILLTPIALNQWVWPPNTISWILLLWLGAVGGIAHWFIILAHRHAPAPTVAPFIYAQLISMTLLGYLIFNDVPTIWTLIGGLIIILSGIYLLYREQQVKAAPEREE